MPYVNSDLVPRVVVGAALICLSSIASMAASTSSVYSSGLGNQANPAISLRSNGGYLVWQDDKADGRSLGVVLRSIDGDLLPKSGSPMLVNVQKTYSQENPDVAVLSEGGGIVVWQGGRRGQRDIFYRKVSENGTWLTSEQYVNNFRPGDQVEPTVSALSAGDAMVAWTGVNQNGAYRSVYGRRIPANGRAPESFLISNRLGKEEHSPDSASLKNGSVVVAWISGSKRYWRNQAVVAGDAVVSARIFSSSGIPTSEELDVSDAGGYAVSCDVAATEKGFVVGWTDRKTRQGLFRVHDASGVPLTDVIHACDNALYSEGFTLASSGDRLHLAWSSRAVDHSKVRVLHRIYKLDSSEFSETEFLSGSDPNVLREFDPCLVANGFGLVFSAWSSYRVGSASDILGRIIP